MLDILKFYSDFYSSYREEVQLTLHCQSRAYRKIAHIRLKASPIIVTMKPFHTLILFPCNACS